MSLLYMPLIPSVPKIDCIIRFQGFKDIFYIFHFLFYQLLKGQVKGIKFSVMCLTYLIYFKLVDLSSAI